MTGVVLLFAVTATAVWVAKRHLTRVAEQQQPCRHRPVVVMDGQVDLCERCDQVINT